MRRLALAAALLLFSTAAFASEWLLIVPTDTQAQHFILEVGGKWPGRTVVSKRVAANGTRYSKRFYDCLNHTVKYLGTGDTLIAMTRSNAEPDMTPVKARSVADYLEQEACKR